MNCLLLLGHNKLQWTYRNILLVMANLVVVAACKLFYYDMSCIATSNIAFIPREWAYTPPSYSQVHVSEVNQEAWALAWTITLVYLPVSSHAPVHPCALPARLMGSSAVSARSRQLPRFTAPHLSVVNVGLCYCTYGGPATQSMKIKIPRSGIHKQS